MKTNVGVWIDHRKAVIVEISDTGEETKVIESNVEKHSEVLSHLRCDLAIRHRQPARPRGGR